MKLLSLIISTATATAVLCGSAYAQETRTLRIIQQSSEDVGYVRATTDDDTVTVEYYVDSNGRGPKHTETITLDEQGVPTSWYVSGTSLMGADVEESFELEDGQAIWFSQADEGDITVGEPSLYAVNDGSPWASYIYAKALLADPDMTMPALPAGELKLEKVGDYAMGEAKTPVSVYRLGGLNMSPSLLALDAGGGFFASFSASSATLLEGYESLAPEFQELAGEIATKRAEELATRLTHNYPGGFAIMGVRIFDPETEQLTDLVTVTVMENRIAAIDPYNPTQAWPDNMKVFDGDGATLMAGLWDMHSHAALGRGLYYLAAGVTSTRDMGNQNELLESLMADMEAGKAIGPRITKAGFIEGRSPYSARYGIIVDSEEEAVDAVQYYVDRDFPFIKIYNSMNPAFVPAIVALAQSNGLEVIGHVPAFTTADRMIEAGYAEITHINQLMLSWVLTADEDTRTPLRLTGMARGAHLDLDSEKVQHTVKLMQENDVGIDPTAVILERLMLSRAGETPAGDVDHLDHMPIGYQRYRKRSFVSLPTEQVDKEYQEGFQRVLDTIGMLYEAGIRILPGTDDGTGFTVHRELELYEKAGIPRREVLKIASWGPAEYLGYEDELGSIEIGKLADFIVMPGNPLEDLRAIKSLSMVVRDGEVFFPSEIYTELNIEPFAEPLAEMPKIGPDGGSDYREASDDGELEFFPMTLNGHPINPAGLPFSGAVRAGDVIYLSGQIGGRNREETDFTVHAREVMEKVRELTESVGLQMSDVFKCTVMLEDFENWDAFNEVYMTYFEEGRRPARSAFAVAGLARDAQVEVECMAYAPEN
ncbi:MAG: amidohydrolase [Ponticaulis sp.]|nr:amidohydrolase [Ponticaulis sp.]